ncbi:MAG: RagB/SusD family nutrient uptake outer membrane protein [Candidatus Nephrothrix sp. EaCA]|nr:MAG: RagB/SusD family nutrient uptake outer membrane protein [Candidatus Nephrothrix sp. EaCA]
MKNNKLMFSLFGLLWLCACSNFLDRTPLDQPSSETFWKTANDFNVALAACYASMQRGLYSDALPCWDNLTDNGYGQHPEDGYGLTTEIVNGNISPNSGGFIATVYAGALADIARANIFLNQLNGFTGFDPSKKKIYEAEVRMLRGYYYSYLYRCYGEVPIIDKPLDLSSQNQPKASAADVFQFMMKDVDFAIGNLEDVKYSANSGHWTKDAAKAFKARMLLYVAYDDFGTAKNDIMQQVKKLLQEIRNYSLAPEFTDNFQDDKQEKCPEIIMSVKYLAPNNYTWADVWYGDWIVVSPLSNLISEFEFPDGSRGTVVPHDSKGVINVNEYTNEDLKRRDSRLAKTVFIDKYIVKGASYTPSNNRSLGTGLQKFLSQNLQTPYSGASQCQQDWVLLRYADVLLMLAEAENEINGSPTQIVYDAVNQVRRRSSMPELPPGLSKEEMRNRIRHERRVELAFEGLRYFDLKRWKIAKQVLNNVKDGLTPYKFEDKNYLWPIPQSEIDKSNGTLIQNPSYK